MGANKNQHNLGFIKEKLKDMICDYDDNNLLNLLQDIEVPPFEGTGLDV
jgi:hypothetical protein